MKPFRFTLLLAALLVLAAQSVSYSQGESKELALGLKPLLDIISGKDSSFALEGKIRVVSGQTTIPVDVRLTRFDEAAFDLEIFHSQYAAAIRRRRDATAFALPHHKVVFYGQGPSDLVDHLAADNLINRLISDSSMAATYAPLVTRTDANAASLFLTGLLKLQYNSKTKNWHAGQAEFNFGPAPRLLDLKIAKSEITLSKLAISPMPDVDKWPEYQVTPIDRPELERQLVRGIRRATEFLAPAPSLTSPQQVEKKVEHGELRWIDGQRVVLLQGTPEEIGKAHGELLRDEAVRCFDSVLHSFGTVQTVVNGRWFRHDLQQAYARLAPHIPEHHKQETRALARSLNLEESLVEAGNVFPEMFHCSGFAVFGRATHDGKLYHGRVLDYMTMIGLQDSATTFIVAPTGKIPFANVGYGGFIGSVSGMNAKAISLGEMGGRGEGKWDGVPMATLMRRALEECSSLDEVMQLWKNSPRTCEYYYVFADGKTNRAVGVAAYPESVEFVQPGEGHPRLGEGIEDAVVLSAGSRLTELRKRVTNLHGQIDAGSAQTLMCRPVAMESNLHNVLFVPEDGILYVANADHRRPAADRPYVRLDLNELLKSMIAPSADPATGSRE